MSGLAALTANYTDSEEEDNRRDPDSDEEPQESSNAPSNQATKSNTATPNSEAASAKSTPTTLKKPLNLVSYGDIQDDNDDKDVEQVPMELESDEENSQGKDESTKSNEHSDQSMNRSASIIEVDAWTEGGRLPPEPPGFCSPRIQESVNKAMKKKQEYGYDMNEIIQRKKAFRNPSIYEKLIQFCEIDEHGTNFPKDLYDGHLFGKESYYDELDKVQKADMERREKAAKERGRSKVPTNPTSEKKSKDDSSSSSTAPKRKSKWDQGPGAQPPPAAVAIAKSIPAFGSLKK